MFKIILILSMSLLVSSMIFGQKAKIPSEYFGNPILVDSTGFFLIPTLHNSDQFSSVKNSSNNYYTNIIFTKVDNSAEKRLFNKDTYIIRFDNNNSRYNNKYQSSLIKSDWIFYLVRNVDSDKNGKIDWKDPVILYVSDLNGERLKRITIETENVSHYFVYESENCVMIKMQKDFDNDNEFTDKDKLYYYLVLNLKTLEEIKRIEL